MPMVRSAAAMRGLALAARCKACGNVSAPFPWAWDQASGACAATSTAHSAPARRNDMTEP
jgi:hypothetical protein